MGKRIQKLLIANRGEIACRVIQSARELGIETVAVFSEPDAEARHVRAADHQVALGGASPAESYLDIDKLVAAIQTSGADAVHPGYGFLSENAAFARAVEATGATFVGPTPDVIERMGDKIHAAELAASAGLPLIPSAPFTGKADADLQAAEQIGFPILVKAAAGGGGRGMRRVDRGEDLAAEAANATHEAEAAFGDGRVFLEKLVVEPRHIEIQVFGDGAGHVLSLGERECSVQRRHQKVIEEAPSIAVDEALRERMSRAAIDLAQAVNYRGAGTVEFVLAPDGNFYFLEMNTRLQVEHAVTEMVTATDLVRWQLDVANGKPPPTIAPSARGHAIECRIYAEDPAAGFLPTGGSIVRMREPAGVGIRVDTALSEGMSIPVEYDPMLAKLIVWAPDREQARERAISALEDFALIGTTTNIAFLIDVLASPAFAEGAFKTTTLEDAWGSWAPAPKDDLALAAATAAAFVLALGGQASAGGGAPPTTSPWEELGAWRLGSRSPRSRPEDSR